jgi:diguanylate cyclase (GGDEF)-like protein/PAS domain S-box-containing protein
MTKSRPFSLFTWVTKHLELKILVSIIVVSILFIPVTSIISYRHAFFAAQEDANTRVSQFVAVIESNASMAAYLSDFSLATEIVNGLGTIPEINGVIFTLSSGVKLTNGEVHYNTDSDIHIDLSTKFGNSQKVGSLDIFINQDFINNQAKDKGISLVLWQVILIMIVLLVFLVLFRAVVSRPIQRLVAQLRAVQMSNISSHQMIEIVTEDEIGFLAESMNTMVKKIHESYAIDLEKNTRIAHLERQFRMIFEYSHAGIALINAQNKVLLSNPAFESIFKETFESMKPNYYFAPELIEEQSEMEEVIKKVRDQRVNIFRDFKVRGRDEVWIRSLFSLIDDKRGELGNFVEMVVYDISDRTKIERHFEYNATHDPLTGLLNRRGGEIRFAKLLELAEQNSSVFVLLLLDLNDFKPVNDKYGHEAGDIVLKEVSSRLRSILRTDDVVVRWGGDEFVISIILENLDRLDLILQDIQASFQNGIEISSTISAHVGASIGVSTSLTQGYDIDALLETADDIMYEVKRTGKNHYQIDYTPKIEQSEVAEQAFQESSQQVKDGNAHSRTQLSR